MNAHLYNYIQWEWAAILSPVRLHDPKRNEIINKLVSQSKYIHFH